MTDDSTRPTIDRRRLLQGLTAASGVGFAGCSFGDGGGGGGDGGDGGDGGGSDGGGSDGGDGGDGGDSGGDMGERVPTVVVEWLAGTQQVEDMRGAIVNPTEQLGIDVNYEAVETGTQIEGTFNASYHHFTFWTQNSDPSRIDPNEMTRRFAADFAGGNGLPSPNDYMNCEYTHNAIQQQNAESEEQRRELVNRAHSIASEEAVWCPVSDVPYLGAYRPDMIEINGTGTQGVSTINPNVFIKSEPNQDAPVVAKVDPSVVESSNHPTLNSVPDIAIWNSLPNSPLLEYNEERELVNNLAEDYEVSDDGRTIEVTLRDGIEFHNGDPITPEDVKWTFEYLASNIAVFPRFNYDIDQFESIEVTDDRRVEFTFNDPTLPFINQSLSRWGILHQDVWTEAGAEENPDEVTFTADEYVGSGPFEVVAFDARNVLQLAPADSHPIHSPSAEWILQSFSDQGSAVSAFIENEIHMVETLTPGSEERIRSNIPDEAEFVTAHGFLPYIMYPQYGFAPTKFEAFRKAWGAAINRQQANQVALNGRANIAPYAGVFMESHPWFPGEENLYYYTDDPQGSVEEARQHLEDAGFTWDDDDNLRYPQDADLSSRFVDGEGSLPNYDEWPCLDADGNYVGCENAPEEFQYTC